jgi:hypothetical protein
MKKNETAQSLLLRCKCKYKDFVLGMHNIPFSCHLYRTCQVYKHLSYPFIIKGDLRTKGSKFILKRPDLGVIMFYEILETIVTDYFSIFKYHIYKTIPDTFQYVQHLEIRYINEDECLLLSFLIYNNEIVFSEKDIKEVIRFKRNIYRTIEHFLSEDIILKVSIANVFIQGKIDLIWNIIRNLKMIHKYTHFLSDKVSYNGQIIKKDDIIQLIKYVGKNTIKSYAKINRCKMVKMNSTKECVIEFLFQKEKDKIKNKKLFDPFSETKIIIRMYEYNGQCTMHILYFFFHAHDYMIMEKFTKKKNQELIKFRNMIENYK